MSTILFASIMALVGVASSFLLTLIYNHLPEAWLQDYGFDPHAKTFRPAKRLRTVPHSVILGILMGLLFFGTAYFHETTRLDQDYLHLTYMFVAFLPFALIVISDQLNRIIPDQLILFVALISPLAFLSDLFEHSLWFASDPRWYYFLLNRLGGGLIGAGLLWGLGVVGSLITRKESMGFGDIKLFFACGLLCGATGLFFVFLLAIYTGVIFAIPLLIRKRRRLRREQKEIFESDDPKRTAREIEDRYANLHFSEHPDYIAFGPFLVIGTAIYLVFEPTFYQFFQLYFARSADLLL